MSNAFLLIPILLPMLLGGLFALFPFRREKAKKLYLIASTFATSAIMIFLILRTNNELFALFTFSGDLDIALNLDGLGKIFAFLVCVLWPLTTIYALEYMKHESRQKMFYTFFLLSYGVTLGIAASGNLLTLYFFYELLTLCTLPLVLQPMNRASRRAGRSYLLYSIGGAAFAFIGMVFVFTYAGGAPFTMGGILSDAAWDKRDMLLVVYVAAFLGFGVKTAVFPLHAWLPKASVAPTPVTALLHAVAVVKAGAFAVIRLTYYCFGTEFLFGTWAQNVVMGFAIFTIVFGSSAALKQVHFKRRLAYSTIANLSYILFGVTLMTPMGLQAGVLHLLIHSIIKIGAFFAAGAVLHNTGREYVSQLDGLGYRMPVTFVCFTVSALSLTGIPLFGGFISKWALAQAAIGQASVMSLVGIFALLLSALLTAIYMLNIPIRAFFPRKDTDREALQSIGEVNGYMTIPMVLLAAANLIFGIYAKPLMDLVANLLV